MITSRFRSAAVLTVLAALLLVPAARAALDRKQQASLTAAQSQLRQADQNLKLAEKAITPGKPLSKLAASRLNSVRDGTGNAEELLKDLPADDEAVKKAQEQLDALKKNVAEIEAAAAEAKKPAPAPKDKRAGAADDADAAKPSPAKPTEPKVIVKEAPARLPGSQMRKLEDVDLELRKADAGMYQLGNLVASVAGETEPQGEALQAANQQYEQIRDGLAAAATTLQELPADHPIVEKKQKELDALSAKLQANGRQLMPLVAKMNKAAGIDKFPQYEKDLAKVEEIAQTYGLGGGLINQPPEKLTAILQGDKAVADEFKRMSETYQPLIKQQTREGKQFANRLDWATKKRDEFVAAFKQFAPNLEARLRDNIDKANQLADQAVAENKPLFFTGGIPQRLEFAEKDLALLKAYNPDSATGFEKDLGKTKAGMKGKRDSLRQAIIDANELPPDRYRGGDRAQIEKLAKAAWAEVQPDAKVLAIRVPSEAWQRQVKWYFSGDTLTKTDKSHIQAQLIVAHDDKLAVIRPINLYLDHLQNETIRAHPMDGKDEELQPEDFILLTKVK